MWPFTSRRVQILEQRCDWLEKQADRYQDQIVQWMQSIDNLIVRLREEVAQHKDRDRTFRIAIKDLVAGVNFTPLTEETARSVLREQIKALDFCGSPFAVYVQRLLAESAAYHVKKTVAEAGNGAGSPQRR